MSKDVEIKEVMTHCPHSIGLDQNLDTVKHMFMEYDIRHLPVQKAGKLVGILSDRDVNFAIAMDQKEPEQIFVKDVYTAEPFVVSHDEPVSNVSEKMASEHLGCALVTEGGKLSGIFTTVDACKLLTKSLRS